MWRRYKEIRLDTFRATVRKGAPVPLREVLEVWRRQHIGKEGKGKISILLQRLHKYHPGSHEETAHSMK